MGDEAYVSWKSITLEDVCVIIFFIILMEINGQPSTDDYWRRDSVHFSIAQRISRDRFRDISRYLHFVDNSTISKRDMASYAKLGRLRPLIHHFQEIFSFLYTPKL